MQTNQTSTSGWWRLMGGTLEQAGVVPQELMPAFGVDAAELDHSSPAVLGEMFNTMWQAALERSGDPAVGLGAPNEAAYGLGVLSQLILAADTVKDAFQVVVRHSAVITSTGSFQLCPAGEGYRLQLRLEAGESGVQPQRYDYIAKVLLQHIRALTGAPLSARAYQRPGPAPGDAGPWRQAFGCDPVFGAEGCYLEFSAADLALPIATANPRLFELLDREIGRGQQRRCRELALWVREFLKENLPTGEPRREVLAEKLGISERSLCRRLAREGTSFAELVNEVRRELAEHYLRYADLSASEIAENLGFGDPASFYRACKRWFGCTPRSLRTAA